MSIQSGTSPGAIISAGSTPAAAVTSVFGRTGAVVAVSGDYTSSQITNASGVAGATVTAALNTLLAADTGFVPTSRTLTAGAGLTGGGDLSANRTFDVVANADGSIIVNANDIQVGVLATDAQHGVRGGGTQHALVVAAGAAGFMSGADKTKLDGISPGAAVSSVFGRTGAVVAVSGDYTSTLVTNSSSVPGATVTAALDAAGTYYWIWANATARQTQAVTAAQVGAKGFQTDIALEFIAVAISGGPGAGAAIWNEQNDGRFDTIPSGFKGATGSVGIISFGGGTAAGSGVPTAINPTNTNKATASSRTLIQSLAVAGSVALFRTSGVSPSCRTIGFRATFTAVLDLVSASSRWAFGIGPANTTNREPSTDAETLYLAADTADTNVQFMCNDGAGTATKVDLGASFPARTALSGYEFKIYAPFGGADLRWMATNLVSGVQVSGTQTTNLPTSTTMLPWAFYITNNTDATAVALGMVKEYIFNWRD